MIGRNEIERKGVREEGARNERKSVGGEGDRYLDGGSRFTPIHLRDLQALQAVECRITSSPPVLHSELLVG